MKGIAATSWATDRIDIFYLDAGAEMAHQRWNGSSWAGENRLGIWDKLGGIFTSVPVAVHSMARPPIVVNPGAPVAAEETVTAHPVLPPLPTSHRLDVFGLGLDYAMYHQILWNGVPASAWPSWERLGGIFLSAPAAIAWNDGHVNNRVDVFGLGLDRAMYRKSRTAQTWPADWERLGGIFTSEPSVVSWGPGRLGVFARGSDFTLRHRAFEGGSWVTTDWQNLGGSLASPPTAVTWGPNRLDVFAIAHDGTLIHRWWDGNLWNEWEALGLPGPNKSFTSPPSVATWGPNRLDVFVIGDDGILYHYWFDGGSWNGPDAHGDDITAAPLAIATAPNCLHLVKPSNAGKLFHRWWNGAQWIPGGSYPGWEILSDHIQLPLRYRFSVDYMTVDTARSLNGDTDTAQSSLSPGNWPTQALTQYLGDWGGTHPKQAQINLLHFDNVTIDLCESVIFNYQIVNKGNPDPTVVDAALNKAGKSLADEALKSIAKQLGAGVAAITSVEIGSLSSVPVIGPILGLVENWLLQQLTGIIFANCDGPVALEQVVLLGRDLHLKTAHGPYRVTTVHPGTDSATGCGTNSKYEVTWTIARGT